MPTELFQRWGLDFIGPINPPAKGTKNRYIIIATDYTTKWVETRALKDNTTASTAKFIFEEIITKFGCPIELVSDQRSHFLNETIHILTKIFMVLHRKSTTYYPQANGQAESTNKVIKTTLTKMVNANRTNWDTKLYAALWAYRTAYKVTTKHTPFSLVFGTEALLPLTFIYPRRIYKGVKNDISFSNEEWNN
jgi:transposase InsO family protein